MFDFLPIFISNPFFSILLTLIVFELSVYIYKKTNIILLNPMLVSAVFLVSFLILFRIDYKIYQNSTAIITASLAPLTTVFAIPLYERFNVLKKNFWVIMISILVGVIVAIVSMCMFFRIFDMDIHLFASILPKSVTTAIAVPITESYGGIQSVMIIAIIIAGLVGAVFGPYIFKLLRIQNPIAKGLALGNTSHALGTTKALELGKTEGAVSSLTITIAGIFTTILTPIIVKIMLGI